MEGGLHHLAPLTGVVNAMGAKLGRGPFSGRDVLFWIWMLLEVSAYHFSVYQHINHAMLSIMSILFGNCFSKHGTDEAKCEKRRHPILPGK